MQPGEEVVVFQAYRHPLSMVSSLKYLGNVFNKLFNIVVLKNNIGEMVSMVCQLCQLVVRQSDYSYERRMVGVGMMYHDLQNRRMRCP